MIEPRDVWRRLEKEGISQTLRRNKQAWSRFNLVEAYKIRLKRLPDASFNDFLAENGIPESAHYAETLGHNIVLWHASRIRHTANILRHGLFHHEGVFFAPPTFGLPFHLADGIPARDKGKPEELVVLACVFDTHEYEPGKAFSPGSSQYRFFTRVSPHAIFAFITHESVECVGETTKTSHHLEPVEFVRRGKTWEVPSRNPRYFCGKKFFSTPSQWLSQYLEFVFARNRELTLFEIFNGIYMNVTPAHALSADEIVEELCRGCTFSGTKQNYTLLRHIDS